MTSISSQREMAMRLLMMKVQVNKIDLKFLTCFHLKHLSGGFIRERKPLFWNLLLVTIALPSVMLFQMLGEVLRK